LTKRSSTVRFNFMTAIGTVYLVGAGPGDPRLITLRGAQVLGRADVVLYDYLVNPEILEHAAPGAECICLGRHGRTGRWQPEAIHQRLVAEARQGKTVVRLKSGDSLVFGRASGEIDCLTRAGIPWEIVPGLTVALAAASYAGVPITDRQTASAVALVTGQETSGKSAAALDYARLAQFPGTLVIYMGITTAGTWSAELMAGGMPPDRPVALIRRCSWPNQQVIRCRLDEVAERVTPYAKFPPPVIAIVGDVARDEYAWNWFERRPLFGHTVVLTRPRHQVGGLRQQLADLGADVVVQPAIEIQDPADWQPVDQAMERLSQFDDLVFSSANGVEKFMARLLHLGYDARVLAAKRLVVIGPGTANALRQFHLHADLQPDADFRAESLLDHLADQAQGRKMLLLRASRGREVLAEGLVQAGADVQQVVVYQSIDVPQLDADVAERLSQTARPWVTVSSSSIARAAARLLLDHVGPDARWASISPLTSAALRETGIEPTVEATAATMDGLLQAILQGAGEPR
jgi:uroporphyrinogen III methyltransferase/synthase